jgi:Na+-translocating ferredoxin:NAD+ oxidoreductase RnfD subunit
MGNWIFGVVMALLSLAGLFIASRAHDTMLTTVGFLLAGFGLAFIFWLIAKNTGHPTGRNEH